MAERFVIDININGGDGKGEGTGSIGATTIGGAAILKGSLREGQLKPETESGKQMGFASAYKSDGWRNKKEWYREGIDIKGFGEFGGKLNEEWTRRTVGIGSTAENGDWEQETLLGAMGVSKAQLKGLGMAAAWKVAQTSIELKNYKSGNAYENAQRSNNMKVASYGAVLLATGFNPIVITGIVGNELVGAYSENEKYKYDRKLERIEITNITQIAGNISYGRNRGGS